MVLPGGGGVDGGDENQFSLSPAALPEETGVHLGLVIAVELQVLGIHPCGGGDLRDGTHRAGLGNLDVGRNVHGGALLCEMKRYDFCLAT